VNHSLAQSPIETRLRGQLGHERRIWPIAIFGVSLLLASGIACAAPSCTITSTAITFSTYDPLKSTALASTGTLGFSCTSGVLTGGDNFTISLSTGSSGTYTTRTMKSGSNILNYNLYTTVADTTVWGNGTAGTATVTAHVTGNNSPVNATVYALIPAKQNVIAGSYSDSIVATVTF
jgi:spore coat protein U-like protein